MTTIGGRDNDGLDVPAASASNVALQLLITGGIAAAPIIGPGMAQLIGTSLDLAGRRKDEAFWGTVVNVLRRLREEVAELKGDRFFAASWRIVPAARETVDEDMLEALAVALAKTANWSPEREAEVERFLAYVLRFSGLHVRMLRVLRDPRAWIEKSGQAAPPAPTSIEDVLVLIAFDESWRPNIRQAWSEMAALGLIQEYAPGPGPSIRLTNWLLRPSLEPEGLAFLTFIDRDAL